MKRNLIAILIFSLHQVIFSNQLEFVGVGEKKAEAERKAREDQQRKEHEAHQAQLRKQQEEARKLQ